MVTRVIEIEGRDPLLFRDGRPFATEPGALTARTLPLPYPGTLAGFVRTCVGNELGWDWEGDGPERALAIRVAGPILASREAPGAEASLLFPAPADAVIYAEDDRRQVMPLRPWAALPTPAGIYPPLATPPLRITRDVKPAGGYGYWPAVHLWEWLANPTGAGQTVWRDEGAPPREERVHVKVADDTYASERGMLFTTEGVAFGWRWSMLARVEGEVLLELRSVAPMGGERRLARVAPAADDRWPRCPDSLRTALAGSRHVRMVLATPALFRAGWQPGWLDADGCGAPPGVAGVTLRLVAAAVKRREAVSGWDLRRGRPGPKPVRWLAPAGSVYFFEVRSGSATTLAEHAWLQPVSDEPSDRNDGYGLALWGIWSYEEG